MARITTSQAPAAKPLAKNLTLTTSYQTLVEADNYSVPQTGFNTANVNARGVVEFSSPLLVANNDSSARTFTVRITRVTPSGTFVIANALPVEPNDVAVFPLNGQFLLAEKNASSGDKIEVLASVNSQLVATVSYTQSQAEEDDVI